MLICNTYYVEVYNRELNIGDYMVVKYGGKHTDYSIVIKIGNNGVPMFNGAPAFYDRNIIVKGYKIENPSQEVIDFYNSGKTITSLNDDRAKGYVYNYFSMGMAVDVCNRKLHLGSFVMWFKQGITFDENIVCYGLLIDRKKVMMLNGIIKIVNVVFKVTNPTEREIEIKSQLLEDFNKVKEGQLSTLNHKMTPGDAYLSSSTVYVYIGRHTLKYDIEYNNYKGTQRVNIPDKYNETQDMFVSINISTNRGKQLWEKWNSSGLTTFEMSKYIVKTGLKYNQDGTIQIPNVLRLNVRSSTLNTLIGHVNIDFDFIAEYPISIGVLKYYLA